MASTLSDDLTFQMLRRIPPQSFVVQWRKYKPNQPIPSAGVAIHNSKWETNTTIQGTVNEIALMSKAKVVVSIGSEQNLVVTGVTGNLASVGNSPANRDSPFNTPSWKYAMANIVTQSRESFNAQSLYLLENTDEVSHAPINVMRGLCARRVASFDSPKISNSDDVYLNSLTINELESCGFGSCSKRADGVGYTNTSANPYLQLGGLPAAANYNFNRDGVKNFEVPLGFYSSLASTYSVIPLGLLSTFSVNGYNQQLTFGNGSKSMIYPTFTTTAGEPNLLTGAGSVVTNGTATCTLYNVEIHVPIVQILSPEIMNGLLSLYRKTASVDVGGVSVPMSLRMNTICYDTRSYPLAGSNIQHFQVPTTEKSIRALGWIVYNSSSKDAIAMLNNTADSRTPETDSPLQYPLCVKGVTLKKVYVRAGRDDLMPCIENNDPNSGEVESFIYQNLKQAAAVFSPFPYWSELVNRDVAGAEDLLDTARCKSTFGQGANDTNVVNPSLNYRTRSNCSVQYGCISFQNNDYRNDESGQVATGISLNNIGRFDVEMDFRQVVRNGANLEYSAPDFGDGNSGNKRIVFIIAYDSILEASANSGVSEITNSVIV